MVDFKFADIGEGIHEGQILKWMVRVGDIIKEGETLCLIETDKVNAEIPSPVTGVVRKLGGEVGGTIHVGNTLALIEESGGTSAPMPKKGEPISEGEETSAGVVGEIEVSSEVIESSTESKIQKVENDKRVLATPVARQLAKELKIDIKTIKGTGEMGRIMKEDIYKAAESKTKKPREDVFVAEPQIKPQAFKMPEIQTTDVTRVPITKLRKTIVKNMVISKSIIPHTTVMDEFNVSKLAEFRNEQKAMASELGIRLTYMPFIIKAVVLALKDYPIFNSSFDHEKEEIIYKHFINIGMAVDTPDGLIVPNVKNADKKSILQIGKELQQLAEESLNRTIQLEKLQNGTFTITNYGVFGSSFGAPVIKHPEVAILGVGKIMKKPIVENDTIVIADMLPISLSIDHRVIDGGDAGRFLMKLKQYLSNPVLLLLS